MTLYDTAEHGHLDIKTAGGSDDDMIRHSGTRIEQTSLLIPFLILISFLGLDGGHRVPESMGISDRAGQYSTVQDSTRQDKGMTKSRQDGRICNIKTRNTHLLFLSCSQPNSE